MHDLGWYAEQGQPDGESGQRLPKSFTIVRQVAKLATAWARGVVGTCAPATSLAALPLWRSGMED